MNTNNKIEYQKIMCYISLFSMFSLFAAVIFIEIDFIEQEEKHNIIDIAWAENINGSESADNLVGTLNKDLIKGLNGNDTVSGKEAGDDISGGSGDDTIYGNEGRDILKGKAGNDRIEGEEGNDKIIGDRGNDMLIGGPGNDTLIGGPGRDVFICGTASDTLVDFNVTQKDTTPENDCEIIKDLNSNANGKDANTLTIQQAGVDEELTSENNNIEEISAPNTTPNTNEQKPDSGFFGLFK